MKQVPEWIKKALGPQEGLPTQVQRSCSESVRQSISLLSWVGSLSCVFFFLVMGQLTMLYSETQISGQIWKAKQILLPFELSPRKTSGWKKSHHNAFPPIQTLPKFGYDTSFFVLSFRLVKVEVFSPPLYFTCSITLPAILGTVFYIVSWNLHPPLCTKHSHSNASPSFPPRSMLSREFALPVTCCGILHISLCVPQGYLPCHIVHNQRNK